MRELPTGRRVILQDGDDIFLTGQGATPRGDRPFLNRFNLRTLATGTIFRCGDTSYETVEALLDDSGTPPNPPSAFQQRSTNRTAPSEASFVSASRRRRAKSAAAVHKRSGASVSGPARNPPDA